MDFNYPADDQVDQSAAGFALGGWSIVVHI